MARHLATVHLLLYVGAACVLVSTSVALVARNARPSAPWAMPVAFAGAVLSTVSEAWDTISHLRLDTHTAFLPGALSFVGIVVVVLVLSLSGRRRRGTAPAYGRSGADPYRRAPK
jgi:hypothetical protein